jgi:hypothetical protein
MVRRSRQMWVLLPRDVHNITDVQTITDVKNITDVQNITTWHKDYWPATSQIPACVSWCASW